MNKSILINKLSKMLSDQLVWQVGDGHGSYLTMEVGRPHLVVREPIVKSNIDKLRSRNIKVIGDCTIWIQDCDWELKKSGRSLVDSNSEKNDIYQITRSLNASKINRIDHNGNIIYLVFDDFNVEILLDGARETTAMSLNFIDGSIIFFRGDGSLGREISPPRIEYRPNLQILNFSQDFDEEPDPS